MARLTLTMVLFLCLSCSVVLGRKNKAKSNKLKNVKDREVLESNTDTLRAALNNATTGLGALLNVTGEMDLETVILSDLAKMVPKNKRKKMSKKQSIKRFENIQKKEQPDNQLGEKNRKGDAEMLQVQEEITRSELRHEKVDLLEVTLAGGALSLLEAASQPILADATLLAEGSKTRSSTFNVFYVNVPASAQTAFNHALDIWSSYINPNQAINVHVDWTTVLPASAVGATLISTLYFESGTCYVPALTKHLRNESISNAGGDFSTYINANKPFYLGTDGNCPDDEYDLVTVAMHEIAHGLGFTTGYQVASGIGSKLLEHHHLIFDMLVETGGSLPLHQFPHQSILLSQALQSRDIFWKGTYAREANAGTRPKLYAPSTWERGVSLVNLDTVTFPNALMGAEAKLGKVVHVADPITIGMLNDMGYACSLDFMLDGVCDTQCGGASVSCGEGMIPKDESTHCSFCDANDCCMAASNLNSDPHFIGFDGSKYDFAGIPGNVFNIITDVDFQLNAFYHRSLEDNRTYMSQLGIKLGQHSVHLIPGTVLIDGVHELFASDHSFGNSTVSVTPDFGTLVQHAGFMVLVKGYRKENGVEYLNIDCSADPLRIHHPHGVLGQTADFLVKNEDPKPVHAHHKNNNIKGIVEGQTEDYAVSDGLFGTTFPFNRFGTSPNLLHSSKQAHYGFSSKAHVHHSQF